MNCEGCGQPMRENVYTCMSNLWEGDTPPSCRKTECPGLRFCSSDCVQKCWRAVNWPKVSYRVMPAIDEEAAVSEAVRETEIALLERLWNA